METLFTELLRSSAVGSALGLGVLLILLVSGNRIPPALRHGLLLLAVLRLMLIAPPVSSLSWENFLSTSPSVTVTSLAAPPGEAINTSEPPSVESSLQNRDALAVDSQNLGPIAEMPASPAPAAATGQAQTQTRTQTLSLFGLLSLLWVTGFIATCLLILTSVLRLEKTLRLAQTPPPDHRVSRSLRLACDQAGVRPVPRLLLTEAKTVSSPALTGLFKPIILFPREQAETLDDDDVRLILLHELAHLKRRDVFINAILLLVQAVHWFNPFAWFLCRRIRVEAERAADAWVLKISGDQDRDCRKSYGNALINLLDQVPERRANSPVVIGVMERKQDLSARIAAIAAFQNRRRWFCTAACLLIGAVFAAVGFTQAPEEKVEMNEFDIDIRVVDEAGIAVPGAAVRVMTFSEGRDGKVLVEAKTNRDGVFQRTLSARLPMVIVQVETMDGSMSGGGQFNPREKIAESQPDATVPMGNNARNLPLFPTRGVTLRFLNNDEEPIEDLTVWVETYYFDRVAPNFPNFLYDTAKTNREGRCTFTLPSDHQIIVRHDRSDLTNITAKYGTVRPPEDGKELAFSLSPAHSVLGTLTLPDGTPVVDATILTNNRYGSEAMHVKTDDQGHYAMHHLEAAEHQFEVRMPKELGDSWSCALQTVTVSDAMPATVHDIEAKRAGVLNVRFIDSITDEVISSIAQKGIDTSTAKIAVNLLELPDDYHEPRGNYLDFSFGDRTEITIDAKVKPITPEDTVSGTVIDVKGTPIENAKVFITPKIFHDPIFTDKDGRFSHLFPDRVFHHHELATIYAEHGGKKSSFVKWPRGSVDEIVLKIGVTDSSGISVSGRIVDQRDDPIEAAEVLLWSIDYQHYRITTKTDALGNYHFIDAQADTDLVVHASHPEYGEDDYRGKYEKKKWLPFRPAPGRSAALPDIKLLSANKSITGSVVDAAGTPVFKALVNVGSSTTEHQPDRRVFTDTNGRFELHGLIDGWIGLNVQKAWGGSESPWLTSHYLSGSEDIKIVLPDRIKQHFYSDDGIDFTGKQAPAIVAEHWTNTDSPPSSEHGGKIRFISLLALDRPTNYLAGTIRWLQKQSEAHDDIEFIIVHGNAPKQQVDEELAKISADKKITIPIAIEPFLGSMSETLRWGTWGALVIDAEGKVLYQNQDYKKAIEFLKTLKPE